MTLRGLVLFVAAAAAVLLGPPVAERRPLQARCIDPAGRDLPCAPAFAWAERPDRSEPTVRCLLDDLAYAAAEAGPEGCVWLVGALALVALLTGLWSRGLRGALRRFVLTWALGAPLCLGLLYVSCFLEGRTIRLGPQAASLAAASLHTQTDRTTGLLSPADLVRWHWRRGFSVLNVSDRDRIDGGRLAAQAAARMAPVPPLLVTVGEEWHGRPDVVLVHVPRAWPADPGPPLATLAEEVHAAGGALFVAHPWDKIPPDRTLETVLASGIDAMEIVNGVIHGGRGRIDVARAEGKRLVGVLDYKYGPHVTALTLLDADLARTRAGVVKALRAGATHVVYAVPGGAVSGEEYKAAALGLVGASAGLHALRATPRGRRAVWLAWIAGAAGLWWLTTRERPVRGRVLAPGAARLLFVACVVLELAVPAGVSWQVRGLIGTIPVPVLLGFAAVVAVPLLAATHVLGRAEHAA